MPYERDTNGVRIRQDRQGDAWANAHRSLGTGFQMHDVDATFGLQVFGANTGDKLFLEYEPDNYENRTNLIRKFAVVSLFDRKATEQAAFRPENRLSLAFYLWQCRMFSKCQPWVPKFFIVVGDQNPPWAMHELNIETAEPVRQPAWVDGTSFKEVWDQLGLTDLRNQLRSWIG